MAAIDALRPALPRHVGLIMDGNRRWARQQGSDDVGLGHRAGAEHLSDLLEWLGARGINHVSAYVLSADNIRKRDPFEVAVLMGLIESVIPARVHAAETWQLHISGDLSILPSSTRDALQQAVRDTRGRPGHLTLAIGYDAHEDMMSAVRKAVVALDVDGALTVDAVSAHLSGGPVKDIDLVIRTGGDRRISGFFPWQSARAELHVAGHAWPAFDEADLEVALGRYAAAKGRLSSSRECPKTAADASPHPPDGPAGS